MRWRYAMLKGDRKAHKDYLDREEVHEHYKALLSGKTLLVKAERLAERERRIKEFRDTFVKLGHVTASASKAFIYRRLRNHSRKSLTPELR
ncbi:MAG: hypothetical protein FWF23_02005 [Alphaproteobacteria bacterium]|nr:hypothetical protein [Alphaproteobacteria bacterium]